MVVGESRPACQLSGRPAGCCPRQVRVGPAESRGAESGREPDDMPLADDQRTGRLIGGEPASPSTWRHLRLAMWGGACPGTRGTGGHATVRQWCLIPSLTGRSPTCSALPVAGLRRRLARPGAWPPGDGMAAGSGGWCPKRAAALVESTRPRDRFGRSLRRTRTCRKRAGAWRDSARGGNGIVRVTTHLQTDRLRTDRQRRSRRCSASSCCAPSGHSGAPAREDGDGQPRLRRQ